MKTDEILKLKNKHSRRLMKKHGLTGVGIGHKKVNGKKTDKKCVVFFVEKKLPKDQITKGQLLPTTLEGYPTDVVETGEIKASSAPYIPKVRPATPGYSVGHPSVTAGTLGCVVYKGSTRYILSNNHVLANSNNATIGDHIYQPGVYDGGTDADTVAYLDSWVTLVDHVNVDCALAEITDDTLVTDVGMWGFPINSYSDPSVDDIVIKTGRTTGTTTNQVIYEHTDVLVNYGGTLGYFYIDDCFVTGVMCAGGDSGSIVRSSDTNAVGLLFASSTTVTVCCYMSNVVDVLGFTFPSTISPAAKYWVGGTGTWDGSNVGSHWSLSSGGTGGADEPTGADDVYFDTNSNSTTTTPPSPMPGSPHGKITTTQETQPRTGQYTLVYNSYQITYNQTGVTYNDSTVRQE